MFQTITIKDKEYKLRINARACVDLEKKLGTNPLNIFMNEGDKAPKMSDLYEVFYFALKAYHPEIKHDEIYDLYDAYCEDGGNLSDFIQLIISIFKDAGFVPDDTKVKNA